MSVLRLAALSPFLLALALALAARTGIAETVALTDVTIHTLGPQGTIANGTLVIEGGRIAALGGDVRVPDGARVIEGAGGIVTPGIFDPLTTLGLEEISLEESTVDAVQRGDELTAAFDIADAVDPRSTVIAVNRAEGVTRALVAPRAQPPAEGIEPGSVLSGQAAVIGLGGGDFVTRRGAAVVANLGSAGGALAGGSRAAALQRLGIALEDAADYAEHRDAYAAGARREYSIGRADLEALLPVLAGEAPLLVRVERASDIRAALALAARHGIRLIVAGGAEAWMAAEALAASGTPVVLEPLRNLPRSFDMLNATLANAARLRAAGVTIAFTEGETHNAANVRHGAGNAVAAGLPWIEGLRAITRSPAEIYGLGEELGALAAGMRADLVLWDGDPLEVTSFARRVFVDGVEQPRASRQTLLRDRYLPVVIGGAAGDTDAHDSSRPYPPAYRRSWEAADERPAAAPASSR